jgi:hypothetical protein
LQGYNCVTYCPPILTKARQCMRGWFLSIYYVVDF